MRTVKVFNSATQERTNISTDAKTWGELKSVMSDNYHDITDIKAIVRETRATLELSHAMLPETDFTLFICPASKVKSGIVYEWELLTIDGMRKYASDRGLKNTHSYNKEQLRSKLIDLLVKEEVPMNRMMEDGTTMSVFENTILAEMNGILNRLEAILHSLRQYSTTTEEKELNEEEQEEIDNLSDEADEIFSELA